MQRAGLVGEFEDPCYLDIFVFSNSLYLVILWDCNDYYFCIFGKVYDFTVLIFPYFGNM